MPRTSGALRVTEADLGEGHDPVDIYLMVDLVHGEAVAVLQGPVAEGDTDDLAVLNGVEGYDDLVENDRL